MVEDALRQTLTDLLKGGQAHVGLEEAVVNLRPEWRIHRPPGLHSVWQLLEHIRITQEDIVRYTLDASWRSPSWPEHYWTENPSDLSEAQWQASLKGYRENHAELLALVQDSALDLTGAALRSDGPTYLRQILLAADHTAYHTGQIISLRRALGDWPPGELETSVSKPL